ncbi:MAG TPA: alkaline phosphatase family protein [Baekduia sp.]|uniref:alkaline phosphatase family protein n=1 Tax=Baekduia sp. TaxID=2600305 RepID=UPI002BAAF387|nr:alkaline phosphatase family protein [Baekduia sp.]HMJ33624.1 alkaline phosphatase family protein [Baekduia sp.]
MPVPCRSCRSPLADDQRYCLECGERQGAPRLDWMAMVAGSAAEAPQAPQAPGAWLAGMADPAPLERESAGPGLPTPRIAAALVLGVLAFGVVLGNAAGPGASPADAGGRRNLTIVASAAPAPAPAAVVPPAASPSPPATDEASVPDDLGSSASDGSAAGTDAASSSGSATTGDAPSSDVPAGGDTPAATDDGSTTTPSGTGDTPAATPAPQLPPVKHVWLVALTGHSFGETFGAASPAPYLATELRARGTLLPWYHAAGHDPAAGGVALLGGQKDATGPFPQTTKTLADQLTGAGRTWKAYVEGAADGLAAGDDPCRRPPEQAPRNPFLRFASITGAAECGSSRAGLDRIAPDIADAESAPAFSYILPGPAHDGSTSLADADAWLRTTVQPILDSKAYADGGLIVVTFDAGAAGDAEAGGGRVGALLLSPFVEPGGTIGAPHDPFSLLASIERLFGLEPLGYAKDTRLKPFGQKVFGAWSPAAAAGS